jgi:deazaflavin-dependent oxidoreductase (nitroreductase family)
MSDSTVPTAKPASWMNALMRGMLKTPGVQRFLGRAIALLTVTGRRSGRPITLPISYERDGDSVVLVTKRARVWWRNLEANPVVRLRLAGKEHTGTASLAVGDPAALPVFVDFLRDRKVDARAYGIPMGPDGEPDPERTAEVLPELVVIRVALDGSR